MLARIFGKPPCKLKSTLLHFVLGETLGRYELSGKLRHLLPEMKLDALILLKFNVERRPGGEVSLQLWFRIFTITRGLSTATSLGLCHLVDQMGMPDSTEFYRHSECKRCILPDFVSMVRKTSRNQGSLRKSEVNTDLAPSFASFIRDAPGSTFQCKVQVIRHRNVTD